MIHPTAIVSPEAELGEGVEVGPFAIIEKRVRIGSLAMIGGGAMVVMDVPPFAVAAGDRARLLGINRIGLKRKGLSAEAIRNIQEAYRILFRSGLLQESALERLEKEIPPTVPGGPEVGHLVGFVRAPGRGITRFRPDRKAPDPSAD